MAFSMGAVSFDRIVAVHPDERSRLFSQLIGLVDKREVIVKEVGRLFSDLLQSFGVQTFQHGSWTQRIALLDSDSDVSCPEDVNLQGTRRALRSPHNLHFVVEEEISDWRILVRHRQTGLQLDVTQKASHSTEPLWKAEHIRRSVDWALDENVRITIFILKLWVRKHADQFQPKNGYPNSYTFLLILLFLLTHREKPVIPLLTCVSEDTQDRGDGLSILPVSRPSTDNLSSEDPLLLFHQFLGFLLSNLKGLQVDFDRTAHLDLFIRRNDYSVRQWTVKEPFTGTIKCQPRGWYDRIGPDIISRARMDFQTVASYRQAHASPSPIPLSLSESPTVLPLPHRTAPTGFNGNTSLFVPSYPAPTIHSPSPPPPYLPPPPPHTPGALLANPSNTNGAVRLPPSTSVPIVSNQNPVPMGLFPHPQQQQQQQQQQQPLPPLLSTPQYSPQGQAYPYAHTTAQQQSRFNPSPVGVPEGPLPPPPLQTHCQPPPPSLWTRTLSPRCKDTETQSADPQETPKREVRGQDQHPCHRNLQTPPQTTQPHTCSL
uniref:PAP-associated domain-containing protein n=1 Tax=Chromera velia CCMP2878 TaxID=1169474 RepID=A0A0G4HCL4_9ALVE